ncbi:MAG: AIDA repeat-containing protein, partial [Mailhella sp.]|nr:AIDA repeat-containing protein [Mailhella sp.]
GVASSITVYGKQNIVGSAYSAKIMKSGSQTIYAKGYAQGTTVSSGGKMVISGGGKSYKTTVKAGGSMTIHKGGFANTTTVSNVGELILSSGASAAALTVNGSSYLKGGVKLTGTTTVGGSLSVEGTGNSVGKLAFSSYGSVDFELVGISASSTAYMLSTSTSQALGGSETCISVSSGQGFGVYELASGFTVSSAKDFVLVVDGMYSGTLNVGSSVTIGSVSYSLSKSGTKLNFTVAAQEGGPDCKMVIGTSKDDNPLHGTDSNDIFYGGAGNDTITGNGGRDVAVYDTNAWGKDTIAATTGTMSILFNGVSESDVTIRHLGDATFITRKSDGSQNIAVEGWNADTHNIVFGGTLSAFNTYLNAASPTQTQRDAARNEVWQKTGLLAG